MDAIMITILIFLALIILIFTGIPGILATLAGGLIGHALIKNK